MRLGQDWVFSAFIRDITDSKLAAGKASGERTQPTPADRNHSGDALERHAGRGDRLLQCSRARLYAASPPKRSWAAVGGKLLHPDDVDHDISSVDVLCRNRSPVPS